MKKRGLGHIEIILSFVLFIAAVGFGLYIFNMSSSSRLADVTLTYAFREIKQNTSASVEVYSVNVNGSLISINPLALNFSGVNGTPHVETYDGRILDSSRLGRDNGLIYVSSPDWATENVLFVIFGEEFQEGYVSMASVHNATYYQIGSSEARELISEKNFKKLSELYRSDYHGLKDQENFNLPDRADFGFSLMFDDGSSVTAENNIPEGFEVFSKTERVEVLRESGSRAFADLIVKVW